MIISNMIDEKNEEKAREKVIVNKKKKPVEDTILKSFSELFLNENKEKLSIYSSKMFEDLVNRYNYHFNVLTETSKRYDTYNNFFTILVIALNLILLSLLGLEVNKNYVIIIGFLFSFLTTFSKSTKISEKYRLSCDKLIELQDWKQDLINKLSSKKDEKKIKKVLKKKNIELSRIGKEMLEGLFLAD